MQYNLFLSIPGLYYMCGNEDHVRFMSRWYYDISVLATYLLSLYCVLIRSRPRYDFSNMFKIQSRQPRSRPYLFLLRSFNDVQVRTASDQFYIDVVGTWV